MKRMGTAMTTTMTVRTMITMTNYNDDDDNDDVSDNDDDDDDYYYYY